MAKIRTRMVINETLINAALEGLELQKKRVEGQVAVVQSMLRGGKVRRFGRQVAAPATRQKRALSKTARKRIASAQKKRWAKYRTEHK